METNNTRRKVIVTKGKRGVQFVADVQAKLDRRDKMIETLKAENERLWRVARAARAFTSAVRPTTAMAEELVASTIHLYNPRSQK